MAVGGNSAIRGGVSHASTQPRNHSLIYDTKPLFARLCVLFSPPLSFYFILDFSAFIQVSSQFNRAFSLLKAQNEVYAHLCRNYGAYWWHPGTVIR